VNRLKQIHESEIVDPQARVITATGQGVVAALRWLEGDPAMSREIFQVLRLRDGKVVAMRDYPDRLGALRAVDGPV